jgi:outer membrane autotransporter protein
LLQKDLMTWTPEKHPQLHFTCGRRGDRKILAGPEALGRLAQLASVSNFTIPRLIAPAASPGPASRSIGVWARGVGEFGAQNSVVDRTGFTYSTGGLVGGMDWQPRQDLILGIGAAYLGTTFNWDRSRGNGTISYAKFGLYGSYFTPRWFVDGVFAGGINWAATARNLLITSDSPLLPQVNRQAGGSQTGHDLSLQGRVGVNLSLADWHLTPMAGLSFFYLHQDFFTESGADGLNLKVQANAANTLRSTLGAQVGWAHNFALDNRVINASLADLGGALAVRGFNGDTDSLLIGAGLTAQLRRGLAISARYGAEVGWSFVFHTVNLGLRCKF